MTTLDRDRAIGAPFPREPDFVRGLRATIAGVAMSVRGWDESWAAPVTVLDAPSGFGEEVWSLSQDVTFLAWLRQGERVVSEVPGHRGRSTVPGDGRINLQIAGSPPRYTAQGPARCCQFYITDALLARVAEGLGTTAELRDDLIMAPDPELWRQLEHYARRSLDRRRPASRVETEALALLLLERLLSQHHGARAPAPMRGGLAAWQVRRACEVMDARLAGAVGLDELAAVAECSPTHFSRAFKQSTGLAPFRWLAERRIERAKILLEESRMPLAEVALAVGFAAQPQFTTAFGRATGLTPARWRRERRG